jgi:type IV pilus biogenesis protein CpaD/CtpE
MSGGIIDGDMTVRGTLRCESIAMPQNAIDNSNQVKAGTNLNADKLEQRFFPGYSQPNSAATAETRTLFVARRSGSVNEVVAGSIAKAVGDSIVTVDVRKNGTTILAAVITLDNANTARVVELGSVTSSAFVAGDWFEVVITATANTGTLPTGVFCQLECDQNGS